MNILMKTLCKIVNSAFSEYSAIFRWQLYLHGSLLHSRGSRPRSPALQPPLACGGGGGGDDDVEEEDGDGDDGGDSLHLHVEGRAAAAAPAASPASPPSCPPTQPAPPPPPPPLNVAM